MGAVSKGVFWNVADRFGFVSDGKILVNAPETKSSRVFDVPNYGTDITELMRRPGARISRGHTEDYEILYFYDANDDGFGYALNLDDPELSEWGYTGLGQRDEEDECTTT